MDPHEITRGLVIAEPWISLILSGRKTWEMRTRTIAIRGPIALIRKGSGLVVGVARLVGCGTALNFAALAASTDRHGIPAERVADAAKTGWVVPWHLAGARPLPAPVSYRHPKGAVAWVKLAPNVQSAIRASGGGWA